MWMRRMTAESMAEQFCIIASQVSLNQLIPEKSLSGMNNKPFGISCRETLRDALYFFKLSLSPSDLILQETIL